MSLRRSILPVLFTVLGALAFAGAPAFAATPEVPTLAVEEPVHATQAVLHGILDPAAVAPSEAGTYEFLYRESKTECKGGDSTPTPPGIALGGEQEPVTETLTGLRPNAEYTVCLMVRNSEATPKEAVSAKVTFKTALPPEIPETLEVNPVTATTATLNGILNPGKEGNPGSYAFRYRQSATECDGGEPGAEKMTPPTKALGHKEGVAQAPVSELLPHTAYTFCLRATNEAGEEALSAPMTFITQAAAPLVEEASVTDVSSTSATLHATVNPRGAETTYSFEYAPAEGTFTAVPGGVGTLPEGTAGVAIEVHIQGLAPGAPYELRVVAANSVKTITGEAVSFITQAIATAYTLPDGRQWEMVSSPVKEGAEIQPIRELGLIKAAADGDAITYTSAIPTEAGPRGFAEGVQNFATRASTGWQARDLTVPHAGETGVPANNTGSEYRFFSEDLSQSIVQPLGPFTPCSDAGGTPQPCLSPEASEQTAFLSTDYLNADINEPCLPGSMSCNRPLVTGCPASGACPRIVEEHANVPPGTDFGIGQQGQLPFCFTGFVCGPYFVAATPDLSHVVLESDTSLIPGSQSPNGLYEWSAGKLSFIGTAENEISEEKAGGGGYYAAYGDHGISVDGSRVIFGGRSKGPNGESLEGLLLRDTVDGETVRLGEGQFEGADAQDSRVFFSSGGELYVVEVAAGSVPLAGTPANLTQGAGLLGHVVGASADGSYVYFVANGVVPGTSAHPGNCARAGTQTQGETCNLYVDHYDGSGWTPKFIAAVSIEDETDWQGAFSRQQARISPNGEWLAFTSAARLTDYDSRDAFSGKPDAEVYLYNASADTLMCASCDPTGARPIGVEYQKLEEGLAGGPRSTWAERESLLAANLPGWDRISGVPYTEGYQARYLSNGGRLFFNSDDALVPQDVNGTEDVYEYEPEGIPEGQHACSSSSASGSDVFKPAHHFEVEGHSGVEGAGCVALISSGNSSTESAFLDASESGADVFFLTSAKLAPQDGDTSDDVYDAHECSTESPCPAAPVAPPPCDTEASCKSSPTPQPSIYGLPSSATFAGPGNLASPPPTPAKAIKKAVKCKRGFVKKKGKCVKRTPQKHKTKKASRDRRPKR
jgi:hypothetical protein